MGIVGAGGQQERHALISFLWAKNASIGGRRMISLVVVAVLGRVHNDGRPAMGLVPIGMLHIRFGAVIRASGIGTRGNGKRRAKP